MPKEQSSILRHEHLAQLLCVCAGEHTYTQAHMHTHMYTCTHMHMAKQGILQVQMRPASILHLFSVPGHPNGQMFAT